MLFNVENDLGSTITGYLVPDNYSEVSAIAVSSGGREILRMQTDELRQSLVDAHRHETGMCGFTLDTQRIPNLESLTDLAITDAESGMLIYRRHVGPAISMRLFRLETHLFPLSPLDDAIGNNFRYVFQRLERFGRETMEQIFHLNTAGSFYASGRLLLRTFEHLLDSNLKMAVLLRNPHYDLAERLLVFKQLNNPQANFLSTRDNFIYKDVIDFLAELNLKDEKMLRRAFRNMPDTVAIRLSNPIVRSLSSHNYEETLYAANISAALDMLASFSVVGLRSHSDLFLQSLSTLLSVPVTDLPPISEYQSVIELGELLCNINTATDLIDRDLELYDYITQSFNEIQQG